MSEQNDFAAAFTSAANGESQVVETPAPEPVIVNEPEAVEVPAEVPAETPPADAPAEAPPADDEPNRIEELAAEPTTREVIKEVEKIVEKYPEFKSDKVKSIYESIINSEDKDAEKTFYEYLREKNRDYSVMSDSDVVRIALEKEHPQWNKKDVELEIRTKYGEDLEKIDLSEIDKEVDPDEYNRALVHNRTVDANLTLMSRDARDSRYSLINDQQSLELPKIQQQPQATAPQGPTAEELAETNRQWIAKVEAETKDLGDFKVKIGDKEFAYKFTDEEKKQTIEEVKNFNFESFAKKQGWLNEDGSSNPLKLAQDVQRLNNMEKIVKSFATPLKEQGKKEAIKDIKNITPSSPAAPINAVTFEDAFSAAQLASRN